jgi:Ternary complex associated domain 9/Clp amino terminal domain, pathogenicity island component
MGDIALKDILINARQEAARMNHHFIGVEHLIIGLLEARGSIIASLIENHGFKPDYVVDAIRRHSGKGSPQRLWAGMPNTPRTNIILGIANDLALENGRDEIAERDLLQAIFDEQESIPARVLRKLGIDIAALAASVQDFSPTHIINQPYIKIDFSSAYQPITDLSEQHLFVLRRMFYGYSQLRIERQLVGGYSGALLLAVTPVHADGIEDSSVVVKLAESADILDEARRYEAHIKATLPPLTARLEDKPTAPENSSIAGLKYTFVAGFDRTPKDLRSAHTLMSSLDLATWLKRELYGAFGRTWWMQRRPFRFAVWAEYDWLLPPMLTLELVAEADAAPQHQIKEPVRRAKFAEIDYGDIVAIENFAIQRIYPERNAIQLALGSGSEAARRAYKIEVRGIDFKQNAFYRGEVIERIVGRVWSSRHETLLNAARSLEPDFDLLADTIPGISQSMRLPNPLNQYNELLEKHLEGSVSRIHGDLHSGNILLGPNRSPFLIDFAHSREGHTLFDWATLEVSLLNDILAHTQGETWDDARVIVMHLAALNANITTSANTEDALLTALYPIIALREIVADCLTSIEDWAEYFTALALCALRAITWDTMDAGGKRLMFLVSALACFEMRQKYRSKSSLDTLSQPETDYTDPTR